MKSNDTHALGYVDGRAVFVGAELEQLTRKGWVRHNAQESWRGQNIDWKNDFRWPAEGTKPLFKLDRLDDLIHQLINVTSDLHRSIQPDPNITTKDSVRSLSPCDECAGTGSIGPDSDPTEMNCEVCDGTGKALMGCVITDAEIDMLAINNCLRIEVVEGTALRIFDLEHQRKFARAYGQLCRDTAPSSVTSAPGRSQEWLAELLARIHRDGGQHHVEVGTEQAVKEADEIVAKLYAERDYPTIAATKPASTASIGDDAELSRLLDDVESSRAHNRDERRAAVAAYFARHPVAAPASAPAYPSPQCDQACYYGCTEGGRFPPSCVVPRSTSIIERADQLILDAERAGMVLTIDLEPRRELAMGNYRMRVDVRPSRETYEGSGGEMKSLNASIDASIRLVETLRDARRDRRQVQVPVEFDRRVTAERRSTVPKNDQS